MSRIHEALKKAEQERAAVQASGASVLTAPVMPDPLVPAMLPAMLPQSGPTEPGPAWHPANRSSPIRLIAVDTDSPSLQSKGCDRQVSAVFSKPLKARTRQLSQQQRSPGYFRAIFASWRRNADH